MLSPKVSLRLGGLTGINEENGNIENSYNSGNITCSADIEFNEAFIAGFSGNNTASINNVYSTGKIFISGVIAKATYIGGTIGRSKGNANNLYCLSNSYDTSIDANKFNNESTLTETDLNSSTFVDKLNETAPNIWKVDKTNINSGYPILFWQ